MTRTSQSVLSFRPGRTDLFPEIQEWIQAFDEVMWAEGPQSCRTLLCSLGEHARERGVDVRAELLNTPYCNTIPVSEQPPYPGDQELEGRITAMVRWNALAMVVQANNQNTGLGGHLSSYASAADLFEVGFNHFFRGDDSTSEVATCDLVYFQPHSAPGVYARAFLEGRLSQQQLGSFRREIGGNGLCSYPHPRLMPDFWQFPTGSMGFGLLTAIYQAKFMRYLEHRGILAKSDRKVWAFVGDGEMDEPESLAALTLAARENLDNLICVVNCNLQRLDGPVRGNGSIVQELERVFGAAGWNTLKILWGSDWDELFEMDKDGWLLRRFEETVDGDLQKYSAQDGSFNRERFFNKYPQLAAVVAQLTDEQIDALKRGGHDPKKIYAGFARAVQTKNQPTVILAQTKKGYGLGRWAEGRMSAHQQKKLGVDALLFFRDRFRLPMSDEDAKNARLCRPSEDSPEMAYLFERRKALGGPIPARRRRAAPLEVPARVTFAPFASQAEDRSMSTTVAFVRMLNAILRDTNIGSRVVPIVADEARTFGMESLFPKFGIYSASGQLYEPEDRGNVLFYKEVKDGQILEEGITEAGALSSWIAAGTSYSSHGIAMLPFYIFYSMFGFQRVGDLIWAAADSRARGFLLGATAGRTTLSGEGLQHQDGSSHLHASTVPCCRAYDPCFAYELAVILESGMKAMLKKQEDVFYYVTLMNENYTHPPAPVGVEEGILRGMYLLRESASYSRGTDGNKSSAEREVQLLGSGAILREVLAAAEILEREWNVCTNVWSVTSFTELRWEAMEAERHNRLHTTEEPKQSWIEKCLGSTVGPVIAATDYVRAVPDLIGKWLGRRYVALGTDGFGRSDTRAALRSFFEIDAEAIAFAALSSLVRNGAVDPETVQDFKRKHSYAPPESTPWSD